MRKGEIRYTGPYAGGEATLVEGTARLDALERPFEVSVSARGRDVWCFASLLALVLVLQFFAGAYRVEAGNYSDESAHFMNALLLRDYLTHAFGHNPFAFAEHYYLSYPKIAPLMWPPFFHVSLGLFLLPGWAPHQAALLFLALLAALAAFRVFRFARLALPTPAAVMMAVLFLVTPIIVDLSSAVMVDIALVALALEATWRLARYYVSGESRHIVLFSVFAACCCLTKGNGLAIALLPPLLMLATGRLHLPRWRGLSGSAIVVAALAAPFVYISYRLCDNMGDFTGTGAAHTVARATAFIRFLWQQLTPVPFALALVGAVGAVRKAWREPATLRNVAPAALVALVAANVLFHTLLPLEYYSGRYVAVSVAPLWALVPFGVVLLTGLAGLPTRPGRATVAVLGVALFSVLVMRPAAVVRRPLGFSQTVESLAALDVAGRRVLVISDESGEGAMITEAAIRHPDPAPTIIRGSKLLADSDWMNNNYQNLFGSTADTLKQLEDLHVDFLVFDASPEAQEMAYWSHVRSVIGMAGDRLRVVQATRVDSVAGPTRPITVYRVTHQSPGPPAKLRINLRYSIGKVLEK